MIKSLPVLERELIRLGRRDNTWLLRTAFAGALLVVIFTVWIDRVDNAWAYDRSSLARIGEDLFELYTGLQWFVLALVTPVVVAQSVLEEKDEQTLELLAITTLSPKQILWGKLLSRIAGMLALVLAGLPVAALALSLGGVPPSAVINTLLQTTVMVVSCGAVACFLALFAKGPVVPAFLTWSWMVFAYVAGAVPFAISVQRDEAFGAISPGFALIEPDLAYMLGPPAAFGVVSVYVISLGAAAFGSLAGGGDEEDGGFGAISFSVWDLEREKRRLALGVLALIVLMCGGGIVGALFSELRLPMDPVRVFAWGWNVAALVVGTGVYLLVCRWALLRQARPKQKKPGWRRLSQEWREDAQLGAAWGEAAPAAAEDEAGAWGALIETGSGTPVGLAPVQGRSSDPGRRRRNLSGGAIDDRAAGRPRGKRWFLREIRGNPVFWRETATRAHGGLTGVVFRAYMLLLGGVVLGFLVDAFDDDGGGMMAVATASWFLTLLVTVLVSASSMAGEKRAETLELLAASRLSAPDILGGKLQAVAAYAGPAFALGALMALGGVNVFARVGVFSFSAEVETGALFWKWLALVSWCAVAATFVAVSVQWIGLRTKAPSRIWLFGLLWTLALAFGPLVLLAIGRRDAEPLVAFFNPIFHEGFFGTVPPSVFFPLSIAFWAVLTALVFRDSCKRLGETAARG